ncbi:MAG TPA: Rv2175c family DNA-binding protein [Mycobacteriales bacterium]|nr:Rv2175c family DNA-binding protein [Mycobacteriales bacterium]
MAGEATTSEVWTLVPEWTTVPDAAEALGVEVTRVRQLIRDGAVLATRAPDDGPLSIPADFVRGGHVLKGLPGVITLLRDARYDDLEALRWLYTPDDTLPGTPAQALVENRGTEVKRRAQAQGF